MNSNSSACSPQGTSSTFKISYVTNTGLHPYTDVIHVVRDGRIQGTLPRAEADEKTVMSLASGETMVSA